MAILVFAVLAAMTMIMFAGWLYQRAANNGGWTDVFWTFGTGATCAATALASIGQNPGVEWRRLLIAAMMAVWAIRLGLYVALRVARSREDVRYADLRHEWGPKFQRNMFGLLIIQAPLTALISLATLFAARQPDPVFRVWDGLGLVVFLCAVIGETVSDRQMKAFKSSPGNDGKVCDVGLWSWSRHPNYFFEALVWVAYPIMAINIAQPLSLTSLIAPVMMFCIVRFGTGVPPLEKAMLKSKGEAYRRYQNEVSALIPRPRRSSP